MARLSELQQGQRARVARIDGTDRLSQRLMEMGLLEGESVEVVGFAPLGDPMQLRLSGYHLSLRKSEAARIEVTPF